MPLSSFPTFHDANNGDVDDDGDKSDVNDDDDDEDRSQSEFAC